MNFTLSLASLLVRMKLHVEADEFSVKMRQHRLAFQQGVGEGAGAGDNLTQQKRLLWPVQAEKTIMPTPLFLGGS